MHSFSRNMETRTVLYTSESGGAVMAFTGKGVPFYRYWLSKLCKLCKLCKVLASTYSNGTAHCNRRALQDDVTFRARRHN